MVDEIVVNEKIKILWVTDDFWQKTGYGIVGRNVLKRLNADERFDVHALCLQFGGGNAVVDGIKCYPRLAEPNGFDCIEKYIIQIQPHVLITLRDVGLQGGYVAPIVQARAKGWKGKWYQYNPVDTKDCCYEWEPIMLEADGIIAMSYWGQQVIKRFFPKIDPILIPHGVDTTVYHPFTAEEKSKTFNKAPWFGSFIAGFVGRNQYRKMNNYGIRAFSKFAKDKNDVFFLFHSDADPASVSDGWSYWHLAKKYGIENKLFPTIPRMSMFDRFFIDDPKMCEIFNAMDCLLYLTGGEGFGIPLIEAQACGVPVITTAYTSGIELVGNSGITIPILKGADGNNIYWEGQNGVEFAIPDENEATKALEKVYSDKEYRKELSVKAREYSLKYDWEVVVNLWKDLILKQPTQNSATNNLQLFHSKFQRAF